MVKMFYPQGVRTYRDGEWKAVADVHSLIEVPDDLVDGHRALGYTILAAITAGINITPALVRQDDNEPKP